MEKVGCNECGAMVSFTPNYEASGLCDKCLGIALEESYTSETDIQLKRIADALEYLTEILIKKGE